MVNGPFVELNTFLKIINVASTGGQAKIMIRSEKVKVNGEVDTRNTRKLIVGDKVMVDGKVYVVTDDLVR